MDDDAWCRGIADGVLRGRGYRLVCTGDAQTAVRIAREMVPDLVLADIGLSLLEPVAGPERRRTDRSFVQPPLRPLQGYAILRPLEVDPGLAGFPVVLLRDQPGPGNTVDGPRFGVPDYVPKPFTPQVLLEKVERSLHTVSLATNGTRSAPLLVARPQVRRESESWETRDIVVEGTIDFVGVPGILEMFHFNQQTGVCTLRAAGDGSAELGFEEGEIVSADTSQGLRGIDAVFQVLAWTRGRFAFALTRPTRDAGLTLRFEQLILEGLRRLDEGRRRFAQSLEHEALAGLRGRVLGS